LLWFLGLHDRDRLLFLLHCLFLNFLASASLQGRKYGIERLCDCLCPHFFGKSVCWSRGYRFYLRLLHNLCVLRADWWFKRRGYGLAFRELKRRWRFDVVREDNAEPLCDDRLWQLYKRYFMKKGYAYVVLLCDQDWEATVWNFCSVPCLAPTHHAEISKDKTTTVFQRKVASYNSELKS